MDEDFADIIKYAQKFKDQIVQQVKDWKNDPTDIQDPTKGDVQQLVFDTVYDDAEFSGLLEQYVIKAAIRELGITK